MKIILSKTMIIFKDKKTKSNWLIKNISGNFKGTHFQHW